MDDDELLKARDVARRWGCDVRTVLRHADKGDIDYVRMWGRGHCPMRFRYGDVVRFEEKWTNVR